ncbi:DUF2306 domain-containing protein [Kitasatospora sp. NPDC005856]|uniref:DUF2306 domain-containing protein n=1 Tax=Kitasatospora sp. NPDC005856 TaxID=3154566 RepID=UPI0033E3C56A
MTTAKEVAADVPQTARSASAPPPWWRRIWIVLFAAYCVGFAVYGGYRYVTLDPEQSRVPIRPDIALHHPLLTVHVLTGVVAVLLAWTQVWPWLRNNHPRVHRRVGWVYYLAGVIPSGLLAFPVAVLTPAGQGIRAALLAMSALWAATTVLGLLAAVQHRYEDHRRWMLRNVALSTTIATSRIVGRLGVEVTDWLLPETYADKQRLVFEEMNAAGLWAALALHLLFVEWYLLRPRRRRRPATRAVAAGGA